MLTSKLLNSCYRTLRKSGTVTVNARFKSSSPENVTDGTKLNTQKFFSEEIQSLLLKLTRVDLDKVYKPKKLGTRLEPPKYVFMTTEDLEKARKDANEKAMQKLQMPPVLSERKEIDEVLIKDANIAGYSESNFIFTDISLGRNDRERSIVVRETDGTLRLAKWQERDRMNQTYFPQLGRKLKLPKVFEPENLKSVLERGEYEFVLDLACCQLEPDHPLYIKTCEQTYSAVDSDSAYNSLRSTRHYGPMVYYLAQNKRIDNLLIENLATDRLEDAVWLVSLYHILNPDCKSKSAQLQPGKEIEFLQAYVDNDSTSNELRLTLKTYKEYLSAPKAQDLQQPV